MTPKLIEGGSREEIARALPSAIKTAMESYNKFMGSASVTEPAEFKSHHDACKAAIAHIQLLTKLAEWVEAGQGEVSDQDIFKKLQDSMNEVKNYESQASE